MGELARNTPEITETVKGGTMFSSLLVPLDGSDFGERCLPMAKGIAKNSGASLHLAQVLAPIVPAHFLSSTQFEYQGLDLEEYAVRHRAGATAYLDRIATGLTEEGVSAHPVILEGKIADELAEYADNEGMDLVVMTTHGRTGVNNMWLGSVADAVVRHTAKPVLLMHPGEADAGPLGDLSSIDHIVVPLDGSELAEKILKVAVDFAKATAAQMTLVHVVSSHAVLGAQLFPLLPDDIRIVRDKAEEYLNRIAGDVRASNVPVEVHLDESDTPASSIAEVAAKLDGDLIALATHGYGGLKRTLLGSVADKVLRTSPLPLLVMRPEG